MLLLLLRYIVYLRGALAGFTVGISVESGQTTVTAVTWVYIVNSRHTVPWVYKLYIVLKSNVSVLTHTVSVPLVMAG